MWWGEPLSDLERPIYPSLSQSACNSSLFVLDAATRGIFDAEIDNLYKKRDENYFDSLSSRFYCKIFLKCFYIKEIYNRLFIEHVKD